jgi:hypothetical protein
LKYYDVSLFRVDYAEWGKILRKYQRLSCFKKYDDLQERIDLSLKIQILQACAPGELVKGKRTEPDKL